jgi:MSHA biogenesis protein MshQ
MSGAKNKLNNKIAFTSFNFLLHSLKPMRALLFLFLCFVVQSEAATYTLTSGSYPPCNTSWSVSGTTYTCTGNGGRVTLASGDILVASTNITIVANNGFSLTNNTIGSVSSNINLSTAAGTVVSAGTNTLYGSIQGGSAAITLVGTTVSGAITTTGNNASINLTGGSVAGLVTSNNSLTTNNTNLSAGATARTGMSISDGTLAGAFTMSASNAATFTDIIMTSGSISGASTVSITGSRLGSSSASVSVTSATGAVTLNSTTVYGNLTAPNNSTINVASGSVVSGTCSPNATPAGACNSAPVCTTGLIGGLVGNYFSNMTLAGSPAATRIDTNVNFDWDTGATGITGIPADTFSIRWTGSLRAPSTGAYQFQTLSDDGVRLWINNVLVIDNWTDHAVLTNTSVSVNLVAGQSYPIKLEFYENGGYAVMKLNWSQPTNSAFTVIDTQAGVLPNTNSSCAVPVVTCNNGFIGAVTGKYYNNKTLTGAPADTRLDSAIDFNWGTGATGAAGVGADNFSIRWDGTVRVATTGGYQFETVSDDGVRLYVNNVLVIDNWTDHSAASNTTSAITLTAGVNYPVRVEFYENGGSAVMQLHWKKPTDSVYSTINSCPSALAGFTVSSSGTGITCAGEPITFTAVDSSGGAIAPVSGTNVTLSTAPATGSWVGGNTYGFNGTATSFTKYLQQTTPATLTMNITDGTSTGSNTINFVDSALKFYGSSSLNVIQNQVAGVASGSPAATNTPILKAIRTDTVTGACVAQVTGTKSVDLAYECVNPITCIAGQVFTVNGTAIKANAKNAAITYLSQNLTFDGTGTANIPLNYSDVGQVTLYGQLSLPASGNDPAKTLVGSSNSFVVKPYTLVVSSALTPTNGSNPGATNTAGTSAGFVAGGSPFQVKVEARKSPGTATSDITPNFGRENTSEAVIKLTPALVYPASGTLTALTGSTSFSATTPTGTWVNTSVIWDQVGSITIQPEFTDNDYLGAGDLQVKTPSSTIGRFYPDHFSLVSAAVSNSCSGFSYLGQPALGFNYQLQAQDANGNVMTNYTSSGTTTNYGTLITPTYVAENADGANGATLSSRFAAGASLTASSGNIQLASAAAVFNRQATTFAPDGPYLSLQLGLDITDSFDGRNLQGKNMNATTTGVCSGASCTAVSLGTPLIMRYGRLRLDDAFGPETFALNVNFATEYWTGNHFSLNTIDSCTLVPRSAISYPAGSITVDANRTVNLTGGSTQGTYTNLGAIGVQFNAGDAGQKFTSPAGGKGGFVVRTNLTTMPWLRFDWNQDGNYADVLMPNANFEFGSYRGNDRVIYWRERL